MSNVNRIGDHNSFGSGNVNVGGTTTTTTNNYGDRWSSPSAEAADTSAPPADKSRNVFVVHGRDEEVRGAMFGLLRKLDLHPLEWEDLVKATGHTVPFLGDVLVKAPEQAQAALVLLTPDDIAMLHEDLHGENEPTYETELTGQPRSNVTFELGMVLMAYPERTLIVEIGTLRPSADINGRNVIRFDGSASSIGKIVERLKQAGCRVNDTGSDWRDTSPFQNLAAYRRMPRR